MPKVEDHSLQDRSRQVGRCVACGKAMPRPRQLRVPVRGSLAVQKGNENRQVLRGWSVAYSGEDLAAPIEHIAAIATGAAEKVLGFVGPVTKRTRRKIKDRRT